MDDLIWTETQRVRAYLDEQNGAGPLETTLRILKVGEEAGEVARAWIGVQGQNPRKGVTHTVDDVVGELADVAFSALVAIASLGADPRDAIVRCAAKAAARMPGPDGSAPMAG